MNTTDATSVDKGSPERNRAHLESLAEMASEEADAVAAHVRNAEARGVQIDPGTRMAMGFAANARKAAAQLDALK
ncbi:hypothetical protein ACIO02_37615 [Streptomyces sp. NPDC087568]|uniref:hypothetical protein n=1 Tax=Streptomyces sp. NPDC087568 TaxID=3365799 RepID=UPI00382446C0